MGFVFNSSRKIMLSIQPQSRLGLNKNKQTLCQNWGDKKKQNPQRYVSLFAMPAPVMWAKVLTGILASHFCLFPGFGVLTSVFAMLAPVKAGTFDEDTLEVQILFSGFGLVTILFAMSAPVMWAAVLTGVPWKAKFIFAVLACLPFSLQCQPQ